MFDSLSINIGVFLIAAFVIAIAGSKMTKVADSLADKTGLGEALVGAILLGGSTSLPGIVTSVTAAATNHPELAISNAIGGIAAQTAFLSIADIAYRKANLEHAAASLANLTQGTLLVALLAVPLLAMAGPEVSILAIHPASFVLLGAYLYGLNLVSQANKNPMWEPTETDNTKVDEPEENIDDGSSLTGLWLSFFLLAITVGVAGYFVAESGIAISEKSGISQSVVGGLFTAISTSLPELVTSVAAVRQGALTLAVSDIIGGNTFDVLFIAFSDFAYRRGSIYHGLTNSQSFVISLAILMTGILLLGLLRRQEYGLGKIGFESWLILILYIGGFSLLFVGI
ncbi:MAG: sodium:calcium antiporter [Cyanobacteriota bacterium]|nr:sodium:calcium antiporter [Cyanobacteriota bacterium]